MFICELCAKPFSQKQHLNRHVNIIHNEVKRFKCKLCSAKFSLKEHLKRHHIAKHAHLPITLKKGSKPEILHKKAFECCKCEDKIFGSNWELKRHESICHSLDLHCPLCKGKEGTSPRAVQPHDPNIIVLQSKAIWEAHMDWHRGLKPYLCEVCLTAYETVQALNIHTSSKHTQIKLLKCLHCHEQFSHRNQISRHFRNVHSIEEQNLDCAFCSCPCTVTSGQYLDHIRLYHPEDKCRVCVYCLQEFDSYSQCQKHVLITHYTKIDNTVPALNEQEPKMETANSSLQCRILVRVHVSKDLPGPIEVLQLHELLPTHLKEEFPQLLKLEIKTMCNPGTILVFEIPLKMRSGMDHISNKLLMTLSRPLNVQYKPS